MHRLRRGCRLWLLLQSLKMSFPHSSSQLGGGGGSQEMAQQTALVLPASGGEPRNRPGKMLMGFAVHRRLP